VELCRESERRLMILKIVVSICMCHTYIHNIDEVKVADVHMPKPIHYCINSMPNYGVISPARIQL